MSEAELAEDHDRWERQETAVLRVLPYFLLVIATTIALLQPLWGMPERSGAVLALAGFAAAWVFWFHTAHPEWRAGRPRLMAGYFAGMMLICAALIALAPWYGIFAFLGTCTRWSA